MSWPALLKVREKSPSRCARLVIGDKEEGPVLAIVDLGNPDGSSGAEAPFVELVVIDPGAIRIVGEGIGVEERPFQKLIRRSMELVRPILDGEADDPSAVASILRIIGAGDDFELGDGVDWRDIGDTVSGLVDHIIGRAIE